MLGFLFGGGWWTVGYLFMWFWLLPAIGVFYYFLHFIPGAGPQGGEAVFALMVLIIVAFLFIFQRGGLGASRAAHAFAYRYLRMPVLALPAGDDRADLHGRRLRRQDRRRGVGAPDR